MTLYQKMKEDLFKEIKIMDATIKGVSDSSEFIAAQNYNEGVRAAIKVLDKYKDELDVNYPHNDEAKPES